MQLIQEYSGPLPHPDHLARFEGVLPGAAERIMAGFERQAQHRQKLEDRVTRANVRAQTRGSWLGFIIAILFLAASIYLITHDRPIEGTILGSVDIVGLVSVFVYGRREQRRERETKNRLMYG
jgi:uncharacterized membrane protein